MITIDSIRAALVTVYRANNCAAPLSSALARTATLLYTERATRHSRTSPSGFNSICVEISAAPVRNSRQSALDLLLIPDPAQPTADTISGSVMLSAAEPYYSRTAVATVYEQLITMLAVYRSASPNSIRRRQIDLSAVTVASAYSVAERGSYRARMIDAYGYLLYQSAPLSTRSSALLLCVRTLRLNGFSPNIANR